MVCKGDASDAGIQHTSRFLDLHGDEPDAAIGYLVVKPVNLAGSLKSELLCCALMIVLGKMLSRQRANLSQASRRPAWAF
jgi:hypothetical protein